MPRGCVHTSLLAAATLAAVLAGAVVPCPPAFAVEASVVAADAERPAPQLLPLCPCGCKHRPEAAGTPTGVGWALLPAARPWVYPLQAWAFLTSVPILSEAPARIPDPVPLLV